MVVNILNAISFIPLGLLVARVITEDKKKFYLMAVIT